MRHRGIPLECIHTYHRTCIEIIDQMGVGKQPQRVRGRLNALDMQQGSSLPNGGNASENIAQTVAVYPLSYLRHSHTLTEGKKTKLDDGITHA